MKEFLYLFILLLLCAGCSVFQSGEVEDLPASYKLIIKNKDVSIYGGGGVSPLDALVIKGARNAYEGASVELLYLKKNYHGFLPSDQKLIKSDGKIYDAWEIYTSGGEKKTIYFDITGCYGKH